MDIDDLFVKNELGEELPIHSNMEEFCIECGVTIDSENDSGWERFHSNGVTTQKVCIECDKKEEYPQAKSESS